MTTLIDYAISQLAKKGAYSKLSDDVKLGIAETVLTQFPITALVFCLKNNKDLVINQTTSKITIQHKYYQKYNNNQCPYCEKKFWRPSSMQAHIRKEHVDKDVEKSIEGEKPALPAESKFKCEFCAASFLRPCLLERHLNVCKKKIQTECEISDYESDSSKKSSSVPSQNDLPKSDINLDLQVGDSMVTESDDEIVIHDTSNVTHNPESYNSDESIEEPAKIEESKDEGMSEISRSVSPQEKFKVPEPFQNEEKKPEIIYRKQHVPTASSEPPLPQEPEEKNEALLASIKKFVDTLTPDNSIDTEKSCTLKIDSDSDEDIFASQDKENKLNECLICGFVGKNDDELLKHLQSAHIEANNQSNQQPSKLLKKFTLTCLRCHQPIRADEKAHICKPIAPLVKVVSRPKLIPIPNHAPRIDVRNQFESMTSFGSGKTVLVPHPQYDHAKRTISALQPEKKKYACFAKKRKHNDSLTQINQPEMLDDSSLKVCKSDHSSLEAFATKIFNRNENIPNDSMQVALRDFIRMSLKSQKSLLERMRPPIREGCFPSYDPHPFYMVPSRVRTSVSKEIFRLLVEPFVCVKKFWNQTMIFVTGN